MNTPKGKTWSIAAIGGILAGLGGCTAASAPPAVPGAPPGADPAGAPAAGQPADPAKATGGEKHQCASDGSCGGKDDKTKKDGKPAPPPGK